jgi:hypothetical protein
MLESLTYAALGERLGCSPEAARAVAKRKRWARTVGNDGKARVQADLGEVVRPAAVRPVSEWVAEIEALRSDLERATRMAAGHRADFEHERSRCDRLAADLMKLAELMAARDRPRRWWQRRAG